MKRFVHRVIRLPAIHVANAALISTLLVGVPVVTGISLGALRVSSNTWLERLLIGGLGLGILANGLLGWSSRYRKERAACFGWIYLYAAILTVAVLAHLGWIHFDWLKNGLGRLSNRI